MKKKKKGVYFTGIIIIILVILPIKFFNRNHEHTKNNSSQILEKYFKIKSNINFYNKKNFVYENARNLTIEDSTILMEDYLIDLEDKALALYNIAEYLKDEIKKYDGLNLSTDYTNIENKIIHGIFEEANQLDIKAMKVESGYIFKINMDELYKNIDVNVKPEFKELSYIITDNAFFNLKDKNYNINIEKVIERIDILFNLKIKYPKSEYIDIINEYICKYVNLLFSVDYNIFMENSDLSLYKKSHIEEIKGYLSKITNLEVKNNINQIITSIEKNNYYLNDSIQKEIKRIFNL